MLFIICALFCEAKPLISHFHLSRLDASFPIYEGESIYLVVSGMGKVRTATAMGYLYAFAKAPSHCAWLNIGIAGHATLPIGTAILAHQIMDPMTQECYYPTFIQDCPIKTATIWTVEQPEQEYAQEDVVYDMEATAFWAAASCFTAAELIHSYKVISDNRGYPCDCIKAEQVEKLITSQIPILEPFLNQLISLSQKLQNLEVPLTELQPFLEKWHFTATEKHQLKRLLQRWKACSSDSCSSLWDQELDQLLSSQAVLKYLEKRISDLI